MRIGIHCNSTPLVIEQRNYAKKIIDIYIVYNRLYLNRQKFHLEISY